jgi:hypothetical protein
VRVAVCFSGLPRAAKTTYLSLKQKLFSPLNPDIFAYLWTGCAERREGVVDYGEELYAAKTQYDSWNLIEWVWATPTNLIEEFSAKHLDREQRTVLYRDKRRNALSMYKGIYEANKLKKRWEDYHGFKYDIVIRARTDISLRGRFEISRIQPENTIVIPQIAGNSYQGGYSDVLAWGSSEAMDYYSEVFPRFYELQKDFWDVRYGDDGKSKGCFWNSHLILKKHLDNGPWKVYTFGTDMRKRSK